MIGKGKNSPISFTKTLSETIYTYLKNAILSSELKANQKINEKEIAERFRVSTTPVREAVLRLAAGGFVTLDSHREATVKEISLKELKEINQVLAVLDGLAAESVVDILKKSDLEELKNLTALLEQSATTESIPKFMEINQAIHKKIWDCVPNVFLRGSLNDIYDKLRMYDFARVYAFRKPGALERSLKEHKEILEALVSRDRERLRQLVLTHWGSLLQLSPFEDSLKESLPDSQEPRRRTYAEKKTRRKYRKRRHPSSRAPLLKGVDPKLRKAE